MNLSLVLAVYNNLHLTKNCYKQIRELYPVTPLIISSGGSSDGTMEWLESLEDDNLFYTHTNKKLSFSETYNRGVEMVKTKRLVLIHNDMIIGRYFLENLEKLSQDDTLLCYTTIEPPIFRGHKRPGKVIMDFGSSFEDFNYGLFNDYVERHKNNEILYDGGVFFMSGTKDLFEDVGYFDSFTFVPAFCEDDDFLLRTKLKGYKLKTTESAITYHFVSQTSRFSEEFVDVRHNYEYNSNRNFVRKWGLPISSFNLINYQQTDNFTYKKEKIGLKMNSIDYFLLQNLEPFFDKINCNQMLIDDYINEEQKNTNYNLQEKFGDLNECKVVVEIPNKLRNEDFEYLFKLQFVLPQYETGVYKLGEMRLRIV